MPMPTLAGDMLFLSTPSQSMVVQCSAVSEIQENKGLFIWSEIIKAKPNKREAVWMRLRSKIVTCVMFRKCCTQQMMSLIHTFSQSSSSTSSTIPAPRCSLWHLSPNVQSTVQILNKIQSLPWGGHRLNRQIAQNNLIHKENEWVQGTDIRWLESELATEAASLEPQFRS